jgi:hypothetical protein
MPPKKDAPKYFNKDHFRETLVFLLVLILLAALFARLQYSAYNFSALARFWQSLLESLSGAWHLFEVLAALLIGASLWWALYSRMKLHNIEKEEERMYGAEAGHSLLSSAPESPVNGKWTRVIEHLNSNNPSDWRLAIIEADIMLDELLTTLGYHGDSIGDKLKAVEPGDMKTYDAAWEAHKVRNRIAHAGSDFELNEREAKRVVALFESVFKEYQII